MKVITVNELLNYLTKESEKGHGDYQIFVTDDEEANGYHGLWYLGQAAIDMDPDDRFYIEESNCDIDVLKDKDKAIYMG